MQTRNVKVWMVIKDRRSGKFLNVKRDTGTGSLSQYVSTDWKESSFERNLGLGFSF
ncbi:hypothetical protein ACE38V_11385 [Cytobacillus sp. Hz8]|uniref:hypothetical protein n=1 Tax=Cytobacillus sp. Hz8 TaxID=3347168 RepID=UPI0035E256F3